MGFLDGVYSTAIYPYSSKGFSHAVYPFFFYAPSLTLKHLYIENTHTHTHTHTHKQGNETKTRGKITKQEIKKKKKNPSCH